jgi:serine/threonine protein kinase
MKGILNGLFNIHEMDYIHRDIKPDNIQMAPNGLPQDLELKIIDFGLSAKQRLGLKLAHEEKIGTVLFMAPEQISSNSYSKKIDMYAAGIVLFFMLAGHHPLYITGGILSDNSHTLKQKVANIEPEKWNYPSYISPLARDFICKLCSISQIVRYDA